MLTRNIVPRRRAADVFRRLDLLHNAPRGVERQDGAGDPVALHAALTREILSGPSGPKVGAFFDLDQTLLAGFSASALFLERLASGRVSPLELGEALLGTLGFALGRTDFSDLVSTTSVGYRGLSESVLEEIGQEVFEKHLATRIYPESRALVRAHRERGHTVAIVSSATRYQADPPARDLGIEHVLCTRLEFEDGFFTGRALRPACYGQGKASAAHHFAVRHDIDLSESYFYTDSHEDLPLLEAVGRPRPLNPSARLAGVARSRGWPARSFSSRGTPGGEQLLRTALAQASIVPSALTGLAVALFNRSRREGVNVAISTWAELASALAGIDVRVEGEEHLWSHRPAVFIFNHQSGVDAILIAKLLRRDFTGIGKREVRGYPVLGDVFAWAGVVFIDRSDPARAIRALDPAVEALSEGRSIAIAPEGTRSRTPRLGRFKKGAFHIAMQAGVPVVPIVFRNSLDVLPRGAWVVRPATVEAVVLPPVDTSGWSLETLDSEMEAIRGRYLSVLES
jgi:putative phosphoserine phosphatase/1-acylglycerol-3-phosphate O-acyltransferase